VFYDLWDTPYRHFYDDKKHQNIRDILHQADTAALAEAEQVFTNSQVVSDRLLRFNNVSSKVLYPPVIQPDRFYCQYFNDEIVYICRIVHHKRQHLLIEALKHTRTNVTLRICGKSDSDVYTQELKELITAYKLEDRVHFESRWISEEEKIYRLSNCLAAAYLPVNEDSYGYPSLEASHSSKPILTTTDAGGVTELVKHGYNGLISDPEPEALAEAMDQLYLDRANTRQMGLNAAQRIVELNISWQNVLEQLLA
jgi:glycosyltransferase involved in cell wall biosynthesis